MTKEKLKQEAEGWLNKWELCNKCENKVDCISNFSYCKKVVLQSYFASAEPREKRIAELEAQIEKMKNWCNCKNYQKCLIELAEQGKGMKPSECCVNCKKWELEDYRTRKKKTRR